VMSGGSRRRRARALYIVDEGAPMPTKLTFDFVSDVSCPWCVIGLRGLEIALDRVGDLIEPEIRFHPFELNPGIAAVGENLMEHIARKYGSTPDQVHANRASMKAR